MATAIPDPPGRRLRRAHGWSISLALSPFQPSGSSHGQAHLSRVLPPLLSLVGKRMRKSAGWTPLLRTTIRARKLKLVLAESLTDAQR